jgi:hypothetical protein
VVDLQPVPRRGAERTEWSAVRRLTCQEVLDQLESYLDEDSVRVQLRSEIEQHLHQCRDCHVYVDSVQKTIVIAKGDEPPMPMHLSSKLQAALDRLYEQDPPRR